MLARIAVASDALDVGDTRTVVANQIHDALLHEVRAHGRLVFSSIAERNNLLRAVKTDVRLPQTARSRWIEMLAYLQQRQRISVMDDDGCPDLASVRTLEELRKKCGGRVQVAVVSDDASAGLGISESTGLLDDRQTPLEVATAVAATQSPTLVTHRKCAERGHSEMGSSREQFWNEVLRPMAEGARSATILDGYLLGSLWDMENCEPWTRGWRTEQVVWLLRHLDSVMAPGGEVRLICNQRSRVVFGADKTADIVYGEWDPPQFGRLSMVVLSLSESLRRGERFPHDRHIRFNYGVALQMPAGFDRLREDTIRDADGMSWQYRWEHQAVLALQSVESRALALSGMVSETVLNRGD